MDVIEICAIGTTYVLETAALNDARPASVKEAAVTPPRVTSTDTVTVAVLDPSGTLGMSWHEDAPALDVLPAAHKEHATGSVLSL